MRGIEKIICGVATVSERVLALKETVDSVIDQVDELHVFQSGYKNELDFLKNKKIKVYSSVDLGVDFGDAGKFLASTDCYNDYYFSIDDDLIYPEKYVQNTLNEMKKYDNEVIVSYHGRKFKPEAKSYFSDSYGYWCLHDVPRNACVDVGGTGVMCFHTSKFNLHMDDFHEKNMADIFVALKAKALSIPIWVLAHTKGWIKHSANVQMDKTIFNTTYNDPVKMEKLNSLLSKYLSL